MNLATAIAELAAAVDAIPGLRVLAYPDAAVNSPQVTITMPDQVTFDETGGSDRVTLMAVLMVAKEDPRTGFAALLDYCSGSGANSIRAAINRGQYTQDATVRATGIDLDIYTLGGVSYYAAVFSIDINGSA